MKEIILTNGLITQVDDADFEWLNQWKWVMLKRNDFLIYAARSELSELTNKWTTIRMHRQILGLTNPRIFGDHIDGNGLNNQRYNLRESTNSQNQMNAKSRVGISKYKGVSYLKDINKWWARIMINGKRYSLGYHAEEIDAMNAYNEAAKNLFGDFALLNKKPD